ncbi:NB-ARC domain-containing protein [Kibdelosporangium philippinense]|uniref:NB-ARC domain-containing protein n=1 Tax=Kibdelosporangium philippinense TaxID=211113 RepID=A0ABS8ZKK3_9PSEU|nr:BTAD domain-containing putative transcriptional regulator [Kibdelosporangium philippinense]MCE7007166.1 NB-ARC domain-containing protein [Kibdelosporangium philippinense]
MEFRVLGPLEVVVDGRVVPIGSARLRCLLAMLLVRANRFVGFDELVEAIWGDSVPANPRPVVYTCVTRLRAITGATIEVGADGYRIAVNESNVDIKRFESAADSQEADILQEALVLWRGEPFVDVPSDYLHRTVVPALVERRSKALERKLELDVRDGRHDLALPELRDLTSAHPMRERLWALLMLALFKSGRQAEALQVYTDVRQKLVDELGVEPGTELRQAHQAVLSGDQASGWRVECQLPIDIADFTNREAELDQILQTFRPGNTVPILTISGPPGMGKSALMLRAAHRLIDDYPDGQWFLRLNGAGQTPRKANDVLGELLRMIGIDPMAIPANEDERAGLLRSRLAGRRVLLVLDDAGSVQQVAPLLPGRPGSAVLVSSRSELVGLSVLYSGKRLALQPLNRVHARELVASIIGSQRCVQDQAGADELTDLCGRLPLALRIAAANLATRPSLRISRYAEDLRTGDRLAKLATAGDNRLAVRAAFDVSFGTLSETQQRAFSLLGVIPGNDFTLQAAAAVWSCGIDEACDIFDQLVTANLVESQGDDRFRFHDLIRVYAASRSREYDRDEAFRRLADWYLYSVHDAVRLCFATVYMSRLKPHPSDVTPVVFAATDEATRWLELERLNYLAIIEHAAVDGPVRYTWQLTDAARPHMHIGYRVAELDRAAGLGLDMARREGNRRAEAVMLLVLGGSESISGRFDDSIRDLTACRDIAAEIGETGIQASALTSLCAMYGEAAMPEMAVRYGEEALELVNRGVEQGDARRISVLANLGTCYIHRGQLREAVALISEGLRPSSTELRQDRIVDVIVRSYLGIALCEAGDYEEALRQFTFSAESHLRPYVAHDDYTVGPAEVYLAMGDMEKAAERASIALQRAKITGHATYEAKAGIVLGMIALSAGERDEAVAVFRRALDTARAAVARAVEIQALIGLAVASTEEEHCVEALNLARKSGMSLLEAKAMTALAEVRMQAGYLDSARELAEQALTMHREFGARPGEEKTLALLARLSEKG